VVPVRRRGVTEPREVCGLDDHVDADVELREPDEQPGDVAGDAAAVRRHGRRVDEHGECPHVSP
jgi:hypothetical protein